MNFVSNIFIIFLIISKYHVNGAGFEYPGNAPPPLTAQFGIIGNLVPFLAQYETPITVRATSAIDLMGWNCLSVYHPTALDAITLERPRINVAQGIIDDYGNSDTRFMCYSYGISMLVNYLLPDSVDIINEFVINVLGFDSNLVGNINEDILECDINDIDCLQDVAETYSFTPDIMASIVVYELIEYLKNDGYNADGSIDRYGNECTANCRPFGDTTNYKPRRNPYNCNQNSKWWVPLAEDNGL